MNKTNILLIEGRRTIGGGQMMSRRICDALSVAYNVSVFLPNGQTPISRLLQDYVQFYYPFKEYNNGKKGIIDCFAFIYNWICVFKSLRQVLDLNNVDVIYLQAPSLIPIVVCAVFKKKIKIIIHLHVVHVDKKVLRLLNFCFLSKKINKIIGVSDYTLRQVSPKSFFKTEVLYNCIDYIGKRQLKQNDPQKYIIAIVGDVMEAKGHQYLFEALKNIDIPIDLIVIGRILDENFYKKLLDSVVGFNCCFTGYVNDVGMYLKNVDLVVIPSILFETFSLSMVEAWGRGIPTIASSLGGMEELVNKFLPQYHNELLFPAKDVTALRNRIGLILSDNYLYKEISDAVYEISKMNFSSSCFQDNLIKIVQDIVLK